MSLQPNSAAFALLSRILQAEGRLAELEHRTNDAGRIYLELIRFGNESGCGGFLPQRIGGVLIERLGHNGLQQIAGDLDAPTCKAVIHALEELERSREPVTEMIARDRIIMKQVVGVKDRTVRMVEYHSLDPLRPQHEEIAHRLKDQSLDIRRLVILLAEHAYTLEKGAPPKLITDLVPDYLSAVPQDPFTETNLVLNP